MISYFYHNYQTNFAWSMVDIFTVFYLLIIRKHHYFTQNYIIFGMLIRRRHVEIGNVICYMIVDDFSP